jgi:hypothetical protein
MTPDTPDNFDQALTKRLAKLGAMPVDTSRLDRALRAQIAAPAAPRYRLFRSLAAIAASLILIALVGMALFQDRPVQASAMLQMHRDIVAGKIETMKVDSVADVNAAFAAFGTGGIKMNAPQMHVDACCMQNLGGKQVYCVLLNEANTPVTLTIADLDAVKPLSSAPVMHNGEAFCVQSSAELNMITVDRGHYRVCLIGQLPPEKLMTLTDTLKL